MGTVRGNSPLILVMLKALKRWDLLPFVELAIHFEPEVSLATLALRAEGGKTGVLECLVDGASLLVAEAAEAVEWSSAWLWLVFDLVQPSTLSP